MKRAPKTKRNVSTPKKTGPDPTPIDLAEVEKLAALNCTDEEIGAWFGVSAKTIQRRKEDPTFAELIERGRAKGRISVRRHQIRLLESGNATMGIWLGKQYLGQRDYQAIHITGAGPNGELEHNISSPRETLARRIARIAERVGSGAGAPVDLRG